MPLDNLLTSLPIKVIKKINDMDVYLKSLPTLMFKRTTEKKSGKISYVSADYGISYSIKIKNDHQEFGWYFIHDRQNKRWYRKTDYMIKVFNKIDPDIADRLFSSFMECTFCRNVDNCGNIPYEYKGLKKMTHYGRALLGLNKKDFDDVKKFFECLEALCSSIE